MMTYITQALRSTRYASLAALVAVCALASPIATQQGGPFNPPDIYASFDGQSEGEPRVKHYLREHDPATDPRCWDLIKVTVWHNYRTFTATGAGPSGGDLEYGILLPQWVVEEDTGVDWCDGQGLPSWLGYPSIHNPPMLTSPASVHYLAPIAPPPEWSGDGYGTPTLPGGICHGTALPFPLTPSDYPPAGAALPPDVASTPGDARRVSGGALVTPAAVEQILEGPCFKKIYKGGRSLPGNLMAGDIVVVKNAKSPSAQGPDHSATANGDGTFTYKNGYKPVNENASEDDAFEEYQYEDWYYIVYRRIEC